MVMTKMNWSGPNCDFCELKCILLILQVIHPTQVPVVHEAFSPSQSRIEWATELINEFRQHETSGKGAFTFRGAMIDMPLVKQAENILQIQNKMKR